MKAFNIEITNKEIFCIKAKNEAEALQKIKEIQIREAQGLNTNYLARFSLPFKYTFLKGGSINEK